MHFFLKFWIQFANILFKVSALMLMNEIDLYFFFQILSLFEFLYQAYRMYLGSVPPFLFSKKFAQDWIIKFLQMLESASLVKRPVHGVRDMFELYHLLCEASWAGNLYLWDSVFSSVKGE